MAYYEHDDREALAEAAYHERRRNEPPGRYTMARHRYDPDAEDAVEPHYPTVYYPATPIERWD